MTQQKIYISSLASEMKKEFKVDRMDEERNLPLISSARYVDSDFSNLHFKDMCFELSDFENASFENSVFSNVSFFGDIFLSSNFSNAKISNCEFYGNFAFGVNFSNSSLSDVKFLGANLKCSNFENSILKRVNFFPDNSGHKCDLSDAKFSKSSFESVKFEKCLCNDNTEFPLAYEAGKQTGLIWE